MSSSSTESLEAELSTYYDYYDNYNDAPKPCSKEKRQEVCSLLPTCSVFPGIPGRARWKHSGHRGPLQIQEAEEHD